MTDIVERLQNTAGKIDSMTGLIADCWSDMLDAVDEIERLRELLRELESKEARLAEAERLLTEAVRDYHITRTDIIAFLRPADSTPAVQCVPPCPEHICRSMSKIGACGLPDSAPAVTSAPEARNG